MTEQMTKQTNVYNINIAVLGTVSAGKSTLLNSLFLEEFTSMNISRNTMVPQIYREIINNKKKEVKEARDINREVSELNDMLKSKMESPDYNFNNDMKPIEFYIHKLKELNFCQKNIYLSFYDIPGLNDSKNHNIYYSYVKKNFHDFDIILYLIDLKTGLNTKDEIDVLNFIMKYSSQENKYVIPIINKSDDMTMDDQGLICESKFKNNYDNIINLLNKYTAKYYNTKISNPVLYSAQESYMYRMLLKNPDWELKEDLRNTIGFNDMGKKYFTLSNDERIIKVKEIVKNTEFIQTMIKMCGYSYLYDTIKNVLTCENQLTISKNKLYHKFKKLTHGVVINVYNVIEIYEKFDTINEEALNLQDIFGIKENLLNASEFVKSTFRSMFDNNDNAHLDNVIQLKELIVKITKHKFSVYLENELDESEKKIKYCIEEYFNKHYIKEYTIKDLIGILEKFRLYEIESLDIFANNYIDQIILNNVDFYKNFDVLNFKSIIEFDYNYKNDIDELSKYISSNSIKKICKHIVKNKISMFISNIKNDNNKNDYIIGLYNLMLFYNYYSNKDIEYSEIYTMLLSYYISIISSNNITDLKYDKDNSLLIIDEKFVNI